MPIIIIATTIGGLGSIGGTFLGGICCGIIQQVTAMLWNSALQDVPLYILLMLFIAFRPTGFLRREVRIAMEAPVAAQCGRAQRRRPPRRQRMRDAHVRLVLLLPIVIVAVLPLLPFVNNYIIAATVRALIFISLGQAWNIVAGIGGLLSLGHGVFLGLGCYTTGILFNKIRHPALDRRLGRRAAVARCSRSSWAA